MLESIVKKLEKFVPRLPSKLVIYPLILALSLGPVYGNDDEAEITRDGDVVTTQSSRYMGDSLMKTKTVKIADDADIPQGTAGARPGDILSYIVQEFDGDTQVSHYEMETKYGGTQISKIFSWGDKDGDGNKESSSTETEATYGVNGLGPVTNSHSSSLMLDYNDDGVPDEVEMIYSETQNDGQSVQPVKYHLKRDGQDAVGEPQVDVHLSVDSPLGAGILELIYRELSSGELLHAFYVPSIDLQDGSILEAQVRISTPVGKGTMTISGFYDSSYVAEVKWDEGVDPKRDPEIVSTTGF
jgi:hypothetical protein